MIKSIEEAVKLAKDRLQRSRDIDALTIVEVDEDAYIVVSDLHMPQLSEGYPRFNIMMRLTREDI